MTVYATRDGNGAISTISKLPREGREALPDDDPEVLAIRQRQADAQQKAVDQSSPELLRRIEALEVDVNVLKRA